MISILTELKELYTDKTGKFNLSKRQSPANKTRLIEIITSQSEFKTPKEFIWALEHDITSRPRCVVCGEKVNFKGGGYYKTCSKLCGAKNPKRAEKTRKTQLERYEGGHHTRDKECQKRLREKYPILPGSFNSPAFKAGMMKKYGVENAFQSEIVKDKIKETCQERYGVEFAIQAPEIIERVNQTKISLYGQGGWNPVKVKETSLERYGTENPRQSLEISEKINKTNLERYGHISPWGNIDIQNKVKATMLERYGVEHGLQNVEIFEMAMRNQVQVRYKYKDMTMPSGKIIKYQGYEGFVIQYLLDAGITEDDLALERIGVPTITYEYDGKSRRYYPDIYIKSKNMLIEVKSTWTYDREIEKNIAKHKASKDVGYYHIIIVWSASKNCILEVIDI